MKAIPLAIPDVIVFEPAVYRDDRGFFFESFNQQYFEVTLGRRVRFVQDNQSFSKQNVLRGLHYQIQNTQGKLVRALSGTIFDVAVDLRKESPTFGQWVGEILSADNFKQLWVPEGFAHGFLVLSETAEVAYKTTDFWAAQHERCILWNDTSLNIQWPISAAPIVSAKDALGATFLEAEVFTVASAACCE